jgi:PmbA protein
MPEEKDAQSLLGDLIAKARRAGADAADAIVFEGVSLSHAQRLGRTEKLERSEEYDLGLRVLIGKRQAIVSANERGVGRFDALVERAIAMARAVPEDPYCGLASPDEIARSWPELDMVDPVEPGPEVLIARAAEAEAAAQAVPGVTNSEGAEASWGRSRLTLAASNGFAGSFAATGQSLSVSVLAGSGTAMERDDDFTTAIHGADLRDPNEVGRNAG